jgi:hypothetical protein
MGVLAASLTHAIVKRLEVAWVYVNVDVVVRFLQVSLHFDGEYTNTLATRDRG